MHAAGVAIGVIALLAVVAVFQSLMNVNTRTKHTTGDQPAANVSARGKPPRHVNPAAGDVHSTALGFVPDTSSCRKRAFTHGLTTEQTLSVAFVKDLHALPANTVTYLYLVLVATRIFTWYSRRQH